MASAAVEPFNPKNPMPVACNVVSEIRVTNVQPPRPAALPRQQAQPAVVSRNWWKFSGGVLRAYLFGPDQAARSRLIGAMGWAKVSQPSIFRIWIWPDAISVQRSIGTFSAQGSTVWVLMRRRNSPFRRSMAFVVRADFHCDGSKRLKVNSRSPASSRLSATARHFRCHLRRNALRRFSISDAVSA